LFSADSGGKEPLVIINPSRNATGQALNKGARRLPRILAGGILCFTQIKKEKDTYFKSIDFR
jgi:hypothetical protein